MGGNRSGIGVARNAPSALTRISRKGRHSHYGQVCREPGAAMPRQTKLPGSNVFWKNALRGLQEAVFLKPNAPKSAFSKRLGSIVRV